MTLDQAIRILDVSDPETRYKELDNIYYHGGFRGNAAVDDAIKEAIRIAVKIMLKYQKEKSNMTLTEFCSLVGGDMGPATINVFQKGRREKYYVSENEGFKEFIIQSVFPADSILRDEYANAEVIAFWATKKDAFDVEIEKLN